MTNILQSEAFWLGLASLLGWGGNSISTRYLTKLPPTSPWRRGIRALHGLLNHIDPEGNAK